LAIALIVGTPLTRITRETPDQLRDDVLAADCGLENSLRCSLGEVFNQRVHRASETTVTSPAGAERKARRQRRATNASVAAS
jgi:hypothetical protein